MKNYCFFYGCQLKILSTYHTTYITTGQISTLIRIIIFNPLEIKTFIKYKATAILINICNFVKKSDYFFDD